VRVLRRDPFGAAREWEVDLAASFLIGDDERDIEAARRAGVRARQVPSNGNLLQALAQTLGPPGPAR